MPTSSTVLVALKYRNGVLVGADSQASDAVAEVRWPVQKVRRVGSHPLLLGFSGSVGTSDRAFERLATAKFRPTTFEKRGRLQEFLDRELRPEYESAAKRQSPAPNAHRIGIWGIAAAWVEGQGEILEYELSGDSSWHEHFHAVGSGARTAYAVYRALGGKELCRLSERTALTAIVRVLQTAIAVDVAGVSEPIDVWRVNADGVKRLGEGEVNTHAQLVDEWERREREALFESDAAAE